MRVIVICIGDGIGLVLLYIITVCGNGCIVAVCGYGCVVTVCGYVIIISFVNGKFLVCIGFSIVVVDAEVVFFFFFFVS